MVARQLEQGRLRAGDHRAEFLELTIEKQLGGLLDKRAVVYGDVRDRETLKKAGIERADALILAVPDEDVALAACRVAREFRPELFIAARTNFLSKGMLCQQAGADYVVVEEVVTAMAMRDAVMRRLVDDEKRG